MFTENIIDLFLHYYYNLEILYDNNKKYIRKGYWTFNMIKKEIESYSSKAGNVSLKENKYNATCTITTDKETNLKSIGPLLGFESDRIISPNPETTSDNKVNINNEPQYIEIRCNLVKLSDNIDSEGKKSDLIITLPITSKQSLFGSAQHYNDIESKVPIDRGVINRIIFTVSGSNEVDFKGKVLLDLYIM